VTSGKQFVQNTELVSETMNEDKKAGARDLSVNPIPVEAARVINVSNRLPVQLGEVIKRSSGGLVSALDAVAEDRSLAWIGWPGAAVPEDEQAEIRNRLWGDFRCQPVFLTDEEIRGYYDGFSNSSVWPLFHYMATYSEYDERWFEAYVKVNQKFAEEILNCASKEQPVWIHDYHLMLVPEMVRRARPDLKIGFFLHTPFPSYELFRCHPYREQLLEGLLGADLIGFHTFGYLRHFRSSLLRLLGVESELDRMNHKGRETRLGVFPIGINWRGFEAARASSEYREFLGDYEQLYANRKLVLSVERMDYTKGIPRKLQAIETFLELNPERRNSTTFMIIAVPSRGGVERYQDLQDEVEKTVGHINGRFATVENTPIHFIHNNIPMSQLTALYAVADVALVTPLVDGMNLVAKEFLACQDDRHAGVLILSEFAGAAQELFNATLVNPYSTMEVANAIREALETPADVRRERVFDMTEWVRRKDSVDWAKSFLAELTREVKPNDATSPSLPITRTTLAPLAGSVAGTRRALFLDYDGTLTPIVRDPAMALPSQQLTALLGKLSKRPDLDVYIISGRKERFLQKHFGDYPFTLVAEHGYRVREPNEDWKIFNDKVDLSWKEQISEILHLYADSTPGTRVENKTSALVWHYRQADPEFGRWKATELLGELREAAANMPVEIRQGKKIIEIGSQQVSKGAIVSHRMERYAWALCAGDDKTDETMFELRDNRIITVKVGDGETSAGHRIGSPGDLIALLGEAIA